MKMKGMAKGTKQKAATEGRYNAVINLSPSALQFVEAGIEARRMSKTKFLEGLLEWYAGQDEDVQTAIIAPLSAATRRFIYQRQIDLLPETNGPPKSEGRRASG